MEIDSKQIANQFDLPIIRDLAICITIRDEIMTKLFAEHRRIRYVTFME